MLHELPSEDNEIIKQAESVGANAWRFTDPTFVNKFIEKHPSTNDPLPPVPLSKAGNTNHIVEISIDEIRYTIAITRAYLNFVNPTDPRIILFCNQDINPLTKEPFGEHSLLNVPFRLAEPTYKDEFD